MIIFAESNDVAQLHKGVALVAEFSKIDQLSELGRIFNQPGPPQYSPHLDQIKVYYNGKEVGTVNLDNYCLVKKETVL